LAHSFFRPIALSQPQELPTTNATTVIWFFRTKSMTDSMLNPTIFENSTPLAKLEKGQYFGVVVQPGTHYFSWTDRPKPRERAFATVRPGEQVFFRTKWRGMDPVDAATWKRELPNLRPIESKNVLSSAVTTILRVLDVPNVKVSGQAAESPTFNFPPKFKIGETVFVDCGRQKSVELLSSHTERSALSY
jgi:hypothetical protein